MSKRRWRPEARTKSVRFSPTGRSWAAASTEGLLIYSLDDTLAFDPFDLDLDITPANIASTLKGREYLKALVMAFRLNEKPITQSVYETIPTRDIKLIAAQLPTVYLQPLLQFIASQMEKSPHLEYHLLWISAVLSAHGRELQKQSGQLSATFRGLQKGLNDSQTNITRVCDENKFTLQFYLDQLDRRKQAGGTLETGMDED